MSAPIKIQNESHGPWSLYLGIALGLSLIFYLYVNSLAAFTDNPETESHQELLQPLAQQRDNPNEITAIILGNSRVRNAFPFGVYPDQPYMLPNGQRLWAVQMAKDAAMFESYKTVWLDILQTHPDYLFVMDILITADRVEESSFKFVSRVLYDWFRRTLTGVDVNEQRSENRSDVIDICIKSFNQEVLQQRLIFSAYRDRHSLSKSNQNTLFARQAIKQAIDKDIKVVVLKIPSNVDQAKPFGVSSHILDYFGLGYMPDHKSLLPDNYQKVEWFEFASPDSSHYCDFVHFNEKGRSLYTSWFIDQLMKLEQQL